MDRAAVTTRPTMRDVAEAAGVSLMTVSRVVNWGASVLPETAARVERAIRRLGYQRNDMARQLRRKGQGSQTIGLLVDDLANPFFSALARAVEDEARLRKYVVLIGSSNDDLRREREVVSAFCARQVDGLIVVPVGGNHRFLSAQLAIGTKVVCVDRPAENLKVDTVVVDNRNGAHKAISHLLSHGHRRIAYLGDRRNIWTLQERYAGFCDAFADLGLEPDVSLVRHGLRTGDAAARAAASLMKSADPPTAIFTTNDLITMGATQGLGERATGSRLSASTISPCRTRKPARHRRGAGPGRPRRHRGAVAVRPDHRRHVSTTRGRAAHAPGDQGLRRDLRRPAGRRLPYMTRSPSARPHPRQPLRIMGGSRGKVRAGLPAGQRTPYRCSSASWSRRS